MNFLDSNVVIYAHTNLDLGKQKVAQSLVSQPDMIISTQVCTEFANALHRKFKIDWNIISLLMSNLTSNLPVHINTTSTIADAIRIAQQYKFSWYDSLNISAALETSSAILRRFTSWISR